MEKNFGKGEAILEIHVANILSNLAKKKLSDKFLSFYDVAHKQRSLCCVHRLHNIMYIAQVNLALYSLIRKFGFDEFAVETGDVGDGFALWTYGFASACVGAVTESEFVHLGYH